MAFVRKIGFLRGSTRDICLTDSNLVAANTTTDTDFTQTIGRKADTAAAGAVTTQDTLVAYVKQAVNLLLGTGVGSLLTLVKAGARPGTGNGVTVLTATGTVFVKAVHFKKLTSDETNLGAGGMWLNSDDTVPLNLQLRLPNGNPVAHTDFTANTSYTFDVGWQLATGKLLRLASSTQGQLNGYQIHVEAYAVTEGASIA